MEKDDTKTATSEQLRGAIDRGHTGSKVPHTDPAAAPLGTDDEAGGTPTDPRVLHEVLQRETGTPAAHSGRGASANSAAANEPPAGFNLVLVAVLVAVVAGIALAVWLLG